MRFECSDGAMRTTRSVKKGCRSREWMRWLNAWLAQMGPPDGLGEVLRLGGDGEDLDLGAVRHLGVSSLGLSRASRAPVMRQSRLLTWR